MNGERGVEEPRGPTRAVFEDCAPGDTVRCPVDGCGFSGTASQVVAHAADVDDAVHDAVERAVEGERDAAGSVGDAEADPTPVEAFVRLFEAAHGGSTGYESERQGGWLFPFDDGREE